MSDILPPAPIDAPFSSYNWYDWYKKVRDAINQPLLWTNITGKPTTLAGYGITDAVPSDAGTYTPTLTNVTNVSSSTAYTTMWTRLGDIVTVTGIVDIDQTANGAWQMDMSLPVASNLTNPEDLSGFGTGTIHTFDIFHIDPDTANNRASFIGNSNDKGNHPHHFTFTYRVL